MTKKFDKDNDKKIVICVSGMTGSGKSTVARKLAKKYSLRYFSGGNALKELAKEEGYASEVRGWWESTEGLDFLQQRMGDSAFDKRIDEKMLVLAKQGNVVLDSWTMPWLFNEGFKIWLEASPQVRAKRVMSRDSMSAKAALEALTKKDERTRQIYKNLYGFDLGNDLNPFDLILSTDDLNPYEVFQAVSLVTDRLVFGH